MRNMKAILPGLIVAGLVGLLLLQHTEALNAETPGIFPELQKFTDCLDLIDKYYVEEVTPGKLIEGAIKGMTSTLDPHSTYLSKEDYKEMQISTTGSFGGLGIELGLRDSQLTVITPIEGTPAFKAGIRPGDRILKIDSTATTDMSLEEAVKLLRGPKGSKVTLTIGRESEEKPIEVTITRAIIHIDSVISQTLEPGYGYIRIRNFQVDTSDAVRKAMQGMLKAGTLKGLVLDLRYNPGGLLDQAIAVSDLFLNDGKIVYTDGRKPEDRVEYKAHKEGTYNGFPIVVIINGGTASAAEIVSGALQDNNRAVIVGVRSFGKASVQTIRPLQDGSALKLTIARYYTPSGRSIQAKGIEPDVVVEQKVASQETTQTFVREKDLRMHLEPKGDESADQGDIPGGQVNLEKDFQLKYGLDMLKTWEVFHRVKKAA
ncbi:MAG TPA: S41 family peptidase [Deltaproteobacteria bacterium]|nr:S41 family peptidase [Deltaproteobacteria bacterium]